MKIKEIMTQEVTSLSPETSVKEALELLLKMKISGLPVIDKEKKLVGMFTEKEILSKMLPSYIGAVGKFVYEENPKAVKQRVISLSAMCVKDLMRKNVITIGEETTLCEVACQMLTQKARRIPVLNKNQEVVGMASRGDVLKALVEEYK
jgi:CBS domain-containing protein